MLPDMSAFADRLTVNPRGHVAAGVSGGADSVFLFFLLLWLREQGSVSFDVIHVNHGLRGKASDGDEEAVRTLCAKYSVPYKAFRVDLGNRTDEGTARSQRYSAFVKGVQETEAEALVLAHHRDDEAETFLMRLIRGAGTDGLSAMRSISTFEGITLLRPLLNIGKDEIRRFLSEQNIEWREDESNRNTDYRRNALRHGLMKDLEKMYPGVTAKIARSAMMIGEDRDALDVIARRELEDRQHGNHLYTDGMEDLPTGLRKRILRLWWSRIGAAGLDEKSLSYEQTCLLDELLKKGNGKENLPGGLVAVRGKNWLHLTGDRIVTVYDPIEYTGKDLIFANLGLVTRPAEEKLGNGKECQAFPVEFLQGCILRTRKSGDRIQPFGSTGSQKLQDYFVNRGVDASWRDEIPLLCRDNQVLWVAGIGAGNIPKSSYEKESVILEWAEPLPWNRERKEK